MTLSVQDFVDQLNHWQAQDISCLDIRTIADFADHMLIVSATSERHAKTLADQMALFAKKQGYLHHIEQDPQHQWTIIDCVDIIVHIMQPDVRELYRLEKFWDSQWRHSGELHGPVDD